MFDDVPGQFQASGRHFSNLADATAFEFSLVNRLWKMITAAKWWLRARRDWYSPREVFDRLSYRVKAEVRYAVMEAAQHGVYLGVRGAIRDALLDLESEDEVRAAAKKFLRDVLTTEAEKEKEHEHQ